MNTRPVLRAVSLGVLLLVLTAAGLVLSITWVFAAETNCMADFSEDTIVAPASTPHDSGVDPAAAGRVACIHAAAPDRPGRLHGRTVGQVRRGWL